jgi:hypothetical protein
MVVGYAQVYSEAGKGGEGYAYGEDMGSLHFSIESAAFRSTLMGSSELRHGERHREL